MIYISGAVYKWCPKSKHRMDCSGLCIPKNSFEVNSAGEQNLGKQRLH